MSNLSDHSDDDSSDNRLYSSDSSDASSIEDSSVSSEHSEDSFYSASKDFFPYNYDDNVESVEPIANEQEAAVYALKLAQEEEEEEILWSRFSGEENIEDWQVVILFVLEYSICFPSAYVDIFN